MTSALIFPRSRKIGRILVNACFMTKENANTNNPVSPVINGLIRTSTTSAINAVINPPMNSTSPVPIKLRTPSTSVMMRETKTPLLFAS